MATRKITLKSIDEVTGNVTFTVADSATPEANKSHTVSGIDVSSNETFLEAASSYVDAFISGIEENKRVVASDDVKAKINVAQNDTEE